MRNYLQKLLRGGLPLALVGAAVGYGLASFFGGLADAQAARRPDGTEPPSQVMKVRLPLAMGLGSFALLALLEAPATLLRGSRKPEPAPAPPVTPSGLDSEVEALLNRILAQSEAEEAETAEVQSLGHAPAETTVR